VKFFDSNIWVGPPPEPAFRWFEKPPELAAEMDRSGTEAALITHFASLTYDWLEGNELTLDWAQDERLQAAISLVPNSTGEVGGTGRYLDGVIARGARAIRLFPRTHSFSLMPWCSGLMIEEMQARQLPLILWHSECSWDQIAFVCRNWPGLSMVIEGTGHKILYDNRMFYQLLSDHPNLFLELHNLTNYLVVEDIVSRFGAERLIYGSYSPLGDPGAATAVVAKARISEEAKALIAHGNLEKLIEEVAR
jgi:hypothetical protein